MISINPDFINPSPKQPGHLVTTWSPVPFQPFGKRVAGAKSPAAQRSAGAQRSCQRPVDPVGCRDGSVGWVVITHDMKIHGFFL